jgi:CBS domain-containing protein
VLSPEMNVFEMRQQMLDTHTRYVPVMDGDLLMGVLSLFDVAKSMIQAQKLENEMLKAYIRDWPVEEDSKDQTSV